MRAWCRPSSRPLFGVGLLLALVLVNLLSTARLPSCSIKMTLISAHQNDTTPSLKLHAQEAWLNGSGFLWMQHSRKAGGTSLCMMLRDNQMGLVQMNQTFDMEMKRRTCQIKDFCFNCNVKDKYNTTDLESATIAAMHRNGRNMIEMEGAGVPIDLLEGWSSFVFVSSLRHPVARAVSSLLHDGKTKCHGASNVGECMSHHLALNETMMRCERWIYNCHSNYYVRMFSGLDTVYTTDQDMLERAKRNFRRFSCVLLQEQWDETAVCLRKLGLFRIPKTRYNVNGGLDGVGAGNSSSDTIVLSFVPKVDRDRLWEMNRVDIEFYEWAKDQILTSLELQ